MQEEAQAAEKLAILRAGLAAQEAANVDRAARSAASAAGLATLQASPVLCGCLGFTGWDWWVYGCLV